MLFVYLFDFDKVLCFVIVLCVDIVMVLEMFCFIWCEGNDLLMLEGFVVLCECVGVGYGDELIEFEEIVV